MKVRELIEALQAQNEEAEVMFTYDYGDHSHTTVATTVSDVVEEVVAWSDYHCRHRVVDFEEADNPRLAKTLRNVVALR